MLVDWERMRNVGGGLGGRFLQLVKENNIFFWGGGGKSN